MRPARPLPIDIEAPAAKSTGHRRRPNRGRHSAAATLRTRSAAAVREACPRTTRSAYPPFPPLVRTSQTRALTYPRERKVSVPEIARTARRVPSAIRGVGWYVPHPVLEAVPGFYFVCHDVDGQVQS